MRWKRLKTGGMHKLLDRARENEKISQVVPFLIAGHILY